MIFYEIQNPGKFYQIKYIFRKRGKTHETIVVRKNVPCSIKSTW